MRQTHRPSVLVSPGTKFDASDTKATYRPSPLIDGSGSSRRLVSGGRHRDSLGHPRYTVMHKHIGLAVGVARHQVRRIRFECDVPAVATDRRTVAPAVALVPAVDTETLSVTPDIRSWTNTSPASLVSPGTRFDALDDKGDVLAVATGRRIPARVVALCAGGRHRDSLGHPRYPIMDEHVPPSFVSFDA